MSQPPPQNEDRLADFLRRYQPEPPPATPEFEEQLMRQIGLAETPNRRLRSFRLLGTAGAIATGALLIWGGLRWMASRPAASVAEAEVELETFVFETWTGATTGPVVADPAASSWLKATDAGPIQPAQSSE
ncbi:hypothetical protein KR51_00030600 [Rubidibacter lacunae KORDI 51-2]|uniref:Uncharacterized protein n=1 Tax=Rubidibacter lacunae KORDI 51-2 TaxID=582515 RepID=U5D799_9CHRO|nr:hypothetical protein [Rubidibacter lacunae]ERN40513.1 hypothetical protein KR51_00030600 [Rubidibacter lacunae KORDI 51-2]